MARLPVQPRLARDVRRATAAYYGKVETVDELFGRVEGEQPAWRTASPAFDGRQRYLVDLAVVAGDGPRVPFELGIDLADGGVDVVGHEVDGELLAGLALERFSLKPLRPNLLT